MNYLNVRTGTAYLFIAQIVFFISAYAMHIVLGRYLGPVEYGVFGVVLYASTIVNSFVASGFPMAVARYISAEPARAEAVARRGLRLQLYLTIPISVAFFVAAPWMALLLGDDTLTPMFRIISPIVVFSGIFMTLIQYYNGKRQYGIQSLWLTLSYVVRSVCVIGLAVLGYRVYGAIAGLVLAIGLSVFLALITRRREEIGQPFPASTMIRFSTPLLLAAIGYALVVDLDMMFVKKLVSGAASAGYYTSAKTIANIAPFAFAALAAALYPAVSSVYSSGDMASLKDYIWKANRLLLQILLPMFVVITLNSKGILGLIYGEKYLAAAPTLCWLALAFSMLAIFLIHRAIILGCGYPTVFSAITLSLLPVCVISQFIFIPIYGLVGAAIASALTFTIGMISSAVFILLKFKAGVNVISTARIILAALCVLTCDILLARLGVLLVPKLAILSFIYLLVLNLSGELRLGQIRDLAGEFVDGIKRP